VVPIGGGKSRYLVIAVAAATAAFVVGAIVGRASAPRPTEAQVHIAGDNADLRLLLRAQQTRR
jgi:hypothetical protein